VDHFSEGASLPRGRVTWRSHPATGPGTLAGKLSRCKEGMARVFAVMVQTC